MSQNFLAFDLGAESGRAVVGKLRDGRLELEVVHRFGNIPVRTLNSLHWDALRLFAEMKDGLRAAGRDHELASVGLDTWGVDFALIDKTGELLSNPHHYRDTRTDSTMDDVFKVVPKAEVFRQTGIQFMPLNTLIQMFALKRDNPALLDAAEKIILIPDLFNYWFTGEARCEYTEATTSQFFNPTEGRWATELLEALELPAHKLGEIIQPGERLGQLTQSVAEDCFVGRIPLITPATHDTGSAVVAGPAEGSDFVYISSGTWSLVGVESHKPVINEKSLEYNFTNEGGAAGTIRFLKNVMGLWVVQECRRQWEREGVSYDYARLTEMAAAEQPFVSLVDPDAQEFFVPGDMPARIREFCLRTGQKAPETPGQVIRTALDSLALIYRWVVERLEDLTGKPVPVIQVVGGGTQNKLLQQLTADACRRTVICGPVEATAIGNIIMQAIGMGAISNVAEGRQIVRRSFEMETYQPSPGTADQVEEAYGRFLEVLKASDAII
ncbi:MAG: rhamnulokinase family protein [Armatimonadota bacterium]